MFGRKKRQLHRLKAAYDDQLLTAIDRAKDRWDHAKQTEEAIADADNQVTANTALTRQTYRFLYREARRRQGKGRHISAAVFRD